MENFMSNLITRGSLFDDFFKDIAPGFFIKPLHGDGLPSPAQIKIDVKDEGASYIVHAEVPGVAKDDIHVSIDGATVALRAEIKQHDSQNQDGKVLRTERYYGAVSRGIQLPQEVDQTQSKAKYENGVLTLTLAKKQASNFQRLAIE
jgi:HSP20 family protein